VAADELPGLLYALRNGGSADDLVADDEDEPGDTEQFSDAV
jgi:hypothetical protein